MVFEWSFEAKKKAFESSLLRHITNNSINEIIDNRSELKQIFDENFDGWEFNIDKVEDPGNSKENTNKNSGSARVACYFLEIETFF